MKHMTLSEFIDSESDEPVFIVDGPQPMVGTACIETAKRWSDYSMSLALSLERPMTPADAMRTGLAPYAHDHEPIS